MFCASPDPAFLFQIAKSVEGSGGPSTSRVTDPQGKSDIPTCSGRLPLVQGRKDILCQATGKKSPTWE